jgi:hypothetical protein
LTIDERKREFIKVLPAIYKMESDGYHDQGLPPAEFAEQ